MPKHKGTDHLRADLRQKIAKLSEISGVMVSRDHVLEEGDIIELHVLK